MPTLLQYQRAEQDRQRDLRERDFLQRRRELDAARTDSAIKAAGREFGDLANDPALMAQVEQQRVASNERARGALRNTARMYQSMIARGATPEQAAERIAPILPRFGYDEQRIGGVLQQLVESPDTAEAIITGTQPDAPAMRPVGNAQFLTNPDTGEGLMAYLGSDGVMRNAITAEPLDGNFIPGISDAERERLRLQQARVDIASPGGQRDVYYGREVGTAEGERAAEDLPFSASETRAAASRVQDRQSRVARVENKIDEVLPRVSNWTTGVGQPLSLVPGTPAANLRADIDTIRSLIGFDELQRMRDNSPTGGALGQVTEREIELLQATIANLEQSQSPEQLRRNLRQVQAQMRSSFQNIADAYQQDYGVPWERGLESQRSYAPTPARQPSSGEDGQSSEQDIPPSVDPADWEYMTPDERALFGG